MNIELVTVSSEDVLPVRVAAFSGLGVSPGGRSDGDNDPATLHTAIRVDGQLLAVGTLNRDPSPRNDARPVWRVRGMATLPGHQGHGYGAQLLQNLINHIQAQGGGLLWGELRVDAIPFYERFGFKVDKDVFLTPVGAEHRYGEMQTPADEVRAR